jgi:phage tail-like protein
MSLTLYNSIGWAVEKQTIAAGGGLTGPVFVSATSTDPNTVRLVFDRRLMLEYRQAGIYRALTLDLASFGIIKLSDGSPLEVVRTIWINDTAIDLATANQAASAYRVTCVAGGVMDFQGNTISLQTQDFTGQQKVDYTSPATIHSFTSGYPGMQESASSGFYPDLVAPYLAARNPNNGDVNVPILQHPVFDLKDDDSGVALNTVLVYFEGNLAYRGDSDAFVAPYNGAASARTGDASSYHFVFEKVGGWDPFETVSVRVYALDSAPIPNTLDTTYSWQTVDTLAPFLVSLSPNNGDVDVPRNSNIVFDLLDQFTGVNESTIWIKVNGIYAWHLGVQQPGFAVTETPVSLPAGAGFHFVINPDTDFLSYQTINVEVYSADNEEVPNTSDLTYSFRSADTEAPFLQNRAPAPSAPNVPINSNVTLEVVDVGYGVDVSSVVIRVNGVLAWTGDFQQPGFAVTKSVVSGGFRYIINPDVDFGEGSSPVIAVQAADLAPAPNSLNTSYSFECVNALPYLQAQNPAPNEHDVLPTADIFLEVMDDDSGVDPATVVIKIAGTTCWQFDAEQGPFNVAKTEIGGGKGFHFAISPLGLLPDNAPVLVEVYAADFAVVPNVLDTSYTFYTTVAENALRTPLGAFYCDRVSFRGVSPLPLICNRFPPPPIEAGVETANGPFDLRATGSIVVTAPGYFTDAEEFTLDDGVHALTHFIFDCTGTYVPSGGYDATHRHLDIHTALTTSAVRDVLIAAIGATSLNVTAIIGGTDTINLQWNGAGAFGSIAITDTVADKVFVCTGMTSERKLVLRTGRRLLTPFTADATDSISKLTKIIRSGAGLFTSGHVDKILQVTGATVVENNRDYTVVHFIDAYSVVVSEEPAADEGPHAIFDTANYDGVYTASTDETVTFLVGDFVNPAAATPAEVVAAIYAHGIAYASAIVARDDSRVRFQATDFGSILVVSTPIAFGVKSNSTDAIKVDKAREDSEINFSVYSPSGTALPFQITLALRLNGVLVNIYDHQLPFLAAGWHVDLAQSNSPGSSINDCWDFGFTHDTPFTSEDEIEVRIYARLDNGQATSTTHVFNVRDWLKPTVVSIIPWDRRTLRVKFSDDMKGVEETGPASVLHVRDVSGRISYHYKYNIGTEVSPSWKYNVVEAPVAEFTTDEVGLFLGSAGARNALNNGAFEILEWLSSSLVVVDSVLVDEDPADLSKDEQAPTVVVSPYRVKAATDRSPILPIFCPIVASAALPGPLTIKPTDVLDRFVHLTFQDDLTSNTDYVLELTRVQDTSDNEIGSLYSFSSTMPEAPPGRSFNLWDMIPDMNKREDATQELERFVRSIDECAQILLGDVDQFGSLLDPLRTKDVVVDVLLEHLGNPLAFVRGLSLQKKRELVSLLVPMYKQRGIAAGIEDSVAFFVGKTVTVVPFDIPADTWTLGVGQLNYNTFIGPSRSVVRYSFYLEHTEDLTAEEESHIREIVEFVRPAHTHFIGFSQAEALDWTAEHVQP